MLQKMRDNLQGWAAKVIIGLIIVTMAMFGFGAFDWFSQADPVVASVNGEKIHQSKLATEVERQRQRIIAQLGPNADPNSIDATMLQNSVLDGLINRSMLLDTAADMGLAVSNAQIDQALTANPQFQVNGKFDQDVFKRLLAGAGHTVPSFRAELTSGFVLSQLSGGVTDTHFATEAEARSLARFVAQTRDVAFLTFDPAAMAAGVTVADADVEDYYQSHPDEFMTPETVDLAYVVLSVAELAKSPDIKVTDDQIKARYDADRAAFTGAEQRRTAHILLKVDAKRDEAGARKALLDARARIQAGQPFEEVAKQMSEDAGSAANGGDLGFLAQGALVPEYEKVAWALQPGEVSEPVVTQFGVHLIKLLDKRAEEFPSFEAKRGDIEASLRRSAAEEIYVGKARELDQLAFEAPENLDAIVTKLGLEIREQAGVGRDAGEGVFKEAKLREAAFSDEVLEKGFNSRAVDLGDRAVVLRVKGHHAAERKPLETVATDVRAKLVGEQAELKARDAAAAALEKVLAGEDSGAVARDAGVDWKVLERTRRMAPGVDGEVLRAAFELPRPTQTARSATSVDLSGNRVAVVTVTQIYDGDYAALSENERTQLRQQWLQTVGNVEFGALYESVHKDASISRR